MDVTPLIAQNASIIQSYAEGKFRIAGQVYEGPVIVHTDHVDRWAVADPLDFKSFQQLVAQSHLLDVVLLGCGKQVSPEMFALRKAMRAENFNVELMDTGAACRTFNVLLTEGRRVVAALLPV